MYKVDTVLISNSENFLISASTLENIFLLDYFSRVVESSAGETHANITNT